jgi:murein DD-endopeptidase MepM/ murein hydrolase activator NlpD
MQGSQIGQIWDLSDGTIQSDGETTVDSHLHFSVHLGGEKDASIDLASWILQEKIGTMIRDDGIDSGGEGGSDPRLLSPDASIRVNALRALYDPSRPVPGNLQFSVDVHSIVGRVFLGYLQRFDDAERNGTVWSLAHAVSLVTGIHEDGANGLILASPSGDPATRANVLKSLFEKAQYGEIFTGENAYSTTAIRDAVVDHPSGNDQPLGIPYRDQDRRIRVRFDLTSDKAIDHVSLFVRNQNAQPTPVSFPLVTVYDQLFADLPLSAIANAFHAPMNANFTIEMQAFGGFDGKQLLSRSLTHAFRVEIVHPEGSGGITNYEMNATTFRAWAEQLGTITQGFDTPVSYMVGRTIHGGYDIANKLNTAISAYIGGTVTTVEGDSGSTTEWGLSVIITDANGYQHRYAHLNSLEPWVAKGSKIASGQVFAYMGHSGNVFGTTGIHLHFEIKDANGTLFDPGK